MSATRQDLEFAYDPQPAGMRKKLSDFYYVTSFRVFDGVDFNRAQESVSTIDKNVVEAASALSQFDMASGGNVVAVYQITAALVDLWRACHVGTKLKAATAASLDMASDSSKSIARRADQYTVRAAIAVKTMTI
ncbi:MAG: hypothetical protein AAGF28_12055 [Pseudomonadota bacterium]